MKEPNYGPVYCAMYPELAVIARKHGYALAIHGTVSRDMDLICIPWVDEPGKPMDVIKEITTRFRLDLHKEEPTQKKHGRLAWTIHIGWGECAIDLSFMPTTPPIPVQEF